MSIKFGRIFQTNLEARQKLTLGHTQDIPLSNRTKFLKSITLLIMSKSVRRLFEFSEILYKNNSNSLST